MSIFDRFIQEALDKQRQELETYYKDTDEYIRKTKIEIKSRLNKSAEYRIMLRDYQQELQKREENINIREKELQEKEESLESELTAKIMKNLEDEKRKFYEEKSQWEYYEKGLRRTELTLLDWFKRLDRKERAAFDEILSDVERYKRYSEAAAKMDGFQFEEYVANLLVNCGYENVVVTQKSGDYGADITAERQTVKYVIQCKYYTSQVGIEAVQQIYAAKIHYNAHVAVVATNSIYTRAAETLARDLNVVLWDGEDLKDLFGTSLNN